MKRFVLATLLVVPAAAQAQFGALSNLMGNKASAAPVQVHSWGAGLMLQTTQVDGAATSAVRVCTLPGGGSLLEFRVDVIDPFVATGGAKVVLSLNRGSEVGFYVRQHDLSAAGHTEPSLNSKNLAAMLAPLEAETEISAQLSGLGKNGAPVADSKATSGRAMVTCLFSMGARVEEMVDVAPAGTSELGDSPKSIVDNWISKAVDAEKLMSGSAVSIFEAVASGEEVAKINAQLAAATNIKDDKERAVALKKVEADRLAVLSNVDWKEKSEALKKENNQAKLKRLGSATFNFALAIMKDLELSAQATSVVNAVKSDLSLIAEVPKVSRVAISLGSQVGSLGKILKGLPQLASVTQVKMPTNTKAKPVEVTDI
jgi:hypothetical protein